MFASEVLILLLPLSFGLTSGLQHQIPTSTFYARRPTSLQKQSTCLWSASVAEDHQSHSAVYDWDEQFDELQSFMSKFGHCNFPQNPSKELQKKYPTLKRFCHDHRVEFRKVQLRRYYNRSMSLAAFDRYVRCCRLEEIGFDFDERSSPWYDRYHELMQYYIENGHIRVTERENKVLYNWVKTQRYYKRSGTKGTTKLSELQFKLMDDIGFEWESELYDELWNAKYKELVVFHNKHGHFMVDRADPLYSWMDQQRQRRAKTYRAITEEQIRLLDEIEFPWKAERRDFKWYGMYDKLNRFQQEHGHCQPDKSTHLKLYEWSSDQRLKREKALMSTEQIKLLDKIDFRWERNREEWPKMFIELMEYFNTHGHLQVSEDDDPDLYEWMSTQRQRYHGAVELTVTDVQIERLEELQFCWSLDWRERTWHVKYTEAVEFFKEHGHVMVTEKENASLYNWIETQGKRYEEVKGQKPLSKEELELLEQVDFPFFDGQPRMAWNGMYAEVAKYREENDGRFPTRHKDDRDLSRWIRQQRHRYRQAYGYAPLSEEQKSLLESVDFPRYPEGKQLRSWYERYDELVGFWKQHGHLMVDKAKDAPLENWLIHQRMRFNGTGMKAKPLSKLQLYLLERIGFTWASDRHKIEWQSSYDKVVEFLEVRGRLPTKSDNRSLYQWMLRQRLRRKPDKKFTNRLISEDQIQQLDKIGFRWEAYEKST